MAHVASDRSPFNGVNDSNKHDQCTFLASSPPSSYAPWYKVPRESIVSVEHPFIICNIEKGVASLGGSGRLQEVGLPSSLLESISDSLSVDSRYRRCHCEIIHSARRPNVQTTAVYQCQHQQCFIKDHCAEEDGLEAAERIAGSFS